MMTAIDRTAYPRPGARLTREELGLRYDLTEADIAFVSANARGDTGCLLLALSLKTRRDFRCFPAPGDIHAGPADLINRAIETLQSTSIDLPAFSTLDRLAGKLRAEAHGRMFDRVAERLTGQDAAALDALLTRTPDGSTTPFNRLKQVPGPATPKTIRLWVERLEWLGGSADPEPPLAGIAHTKLRQFAAEAAATGAHAVPG